MSSPSKDVGVYRSLIIYIVVSTSVLLNGQQLVEEYACFNTIFEIVCPSDSDVVIFETARYGRNDTLVSALCEIPFTRNCDVDVHFLLNRACAGRRKCSIVVNTAFFGDPCGYEEFLRVTYRCVPGVALQSRCSETESIALYNSGYITSPNYPDKYYMDAECRWSVHVQRRQAIRITLLDFELDVKRGGRCYDYLEIASGDRTFFRDCGALGRQIVDVDTSCSHVIVTFRTGQTSLTQRGFLLHFEAVGHGCPTLDDDDRRRVVYFVDGDSFYANLSCAEGHVFDDEPRSTTTKIVECLDFFWDSRVPHCITVEEAVRATPHSVFNGRRHEDSTLVSIQRDVDHSVSIVGVTLGVVLALLVITLMLMTAMYCCHRRRRHRSLIGKTHRHYLPSQRRNHQWTMVINNLNDVNNDDDNEVKPMNCRRRPSLNAGSGASLAQVKDQTAGTLQSGQDDHDWTAAGRRLLLSADETTPTSSMSSPWQRYMSADVAGAPPAAYCPVCSPVYAGTQCQRYAAPPRTVNNASYCPRRPDLDVYRTTHHSPDLLGPLPDTSRGAPAVPCQAAAALRAVSCSAPDLIELSSRLQERQQDADDDDDDGQVRCVTSFPVARHVSQSTAVVCEQSPSRKQRRTTNDDR